MAENDTLLREVDEDVRRDKMQALWKQYRKPFFLAIGLLVAVTAGHSIWSDHQEKRAGESMLVLDRGIVAYEAGDYKKAAGVFTALAEKNSGELNDLARWWQARALTASEDAKQALAVLHGLADKPAGRDMLWRDLACLQLMGAGVDAPKPCSSTADSPLVTQRLEWQAANLWLAGDAKAARAILEPMASDQALSGAQRARAAQLNAALDTEVK